MEKEKDSETDNQTGGDRLTLKTLEQRQRDREAETDERLDAVNRDLASVDGKLDNLSNQLSELLSGMTAKNRGTSAISPLDITDLESSPDFTAEFKPGEAIELIGRPGLLDVNSKEFKDHADEMAFMEQVLIIRVMPGADEKADRIVPVSVNGRMLYLLRDVPIRLKRSYVYTLAKARPLSYQNVKRVNPDGSEEYVWPGSQGMRYPFQVLEDPAGQRGAAWLQRVYAEPL